MQFTLLNKHGFFSYLLNKKTLKNMKIDFFTLYPCMNRKPSILIFRELCFSLNQNEFKKDQH